jgi:hypothetical protein
VHGEFQNRWHILGFRKLVTIVAGTASGPCGNEITPAGKLQMHILGAIAEFEAGTHPVDRYRDRRKHRVHMKTLNAESRGTLED